MKRFFFTLCACVALSALTQAAFSQNVDTEKVEVATEDESAEVETKEPDEKYRLNDVAFDSRDKTKVSALKRNLPEIDTHRVFTSKEELEEYLHDLYQSLVNTRLLKDIEYSYEISGADGDVQLVNAKYSFGDSHSMIIFPKPSLDTNSGIEVKFKLKDDNFLGLMNDLNIDLNLQFGDEDEPDNYSKITTGFSFQYDLPFNIGITEDTWSNDFDFNWTIGESLPEYAYTTGLTFAIPVGMHKVQFSLAQSVIRDTDYSKYDDELYFVEEAGFSIPFFIGHIGNTTEVKYTPSITLTHNWDADGIDDKNEDLVQTPMLKFGQNIAFDNVNWSEGNSFRTGYSFSATQYLGWDFNADTLDENLVPSVEAEAKLFKGFKYIGFAIRVKGMAGLNTKFKIGEYVRGAPDNQHFHGYDVDDDNYALKTPGAIVFNFDMPVHIVTTNWLGWSHAIFGDYDTKPSFIRAIAFLPHKLFRYTDFELQFSPFADAALIKNRGTGHNLDYKEGIYTGGLEVLVYPLKWRSFVVRASVGVDGAKKVLDGHKGFDSSWRGGKAWEAYFGLGLHF